METFSCMKCLVEHWTKFLFEIDKIYIRDWGSILRSYDLLVFCIKSEYLTSSIKSKQITSCIKSECLTLQSTIRLYDLHPLISFLPAIPHSRFLTGPCIWILLIPFFFVIANYRAVNLKAHKRGKFENILDLYYTIECIVGFFIELEGDSFKWTFHREKK